MTMIRSRLVWLLAGAALVYALAFTAFGSHGASTHSARLADRVDRPADSPAAGERAQSAFSRRVATADLRARSGRANASEWDGPLLSSTPAEPFSNSSRADSTPEPIPLEAYVQGYEVALAREPQDREWNRRVQKTLTAALASADLKGAHLRDQRCSATLCRVDLVYDSLPAR
jgi:hypothetical protein